ncbi:NADP oxidoreductase [Conexibacter sp. W3-3-2]|uniref:FAD-dependent oxidoreductase n=1 Tax=Conexibacter sp. W3-3-2 TaxID=2675227 RepID=UPI0012BA19B9|nr:FAD-dependent oxidoreductase [Conexibacter sp. W3-3-2]MTD44787.1 NADP oxidoreductase [Conexibacter sp. W3-3-2]
MSAPLRVAIVGAGPAGFYAAGDLLKAGDGSVEVDLFDRLPTPYGLVRAGVAPDHPNIKVVTKVYEKTAAKPGFRYHGNVEIGRDITPAELREHFHAVLYTVGAPNDRKLGIPGEDLPGSLGAADFVGWYNGHPDFRDLDPDLSGERAVVVGAGNVALDCARMLGVPVAELQSTDTADHALAALAASSIREVVILARRGPLQGAYTNPELLELGEIEGLDVIVDADDVRLDDAHRALLETADKTTRRNVEIVTDYAGRVPTGASRRIVLKFFSSPVEILGEDRVEGVRIVRNELVQNEDGSFSARPTEVTETIAAGLVLRSIGYLGAPLDGVPFDERRGTIRNVDGRVTEEDGTVVPGVYTAGWVKRGPSGVIGTNKKCAQETVRELRADAEAGLLADPPKGAAELDALLAERVPDRIDYAAWGRIDAHEVAAGEPAGRPRVKLVDIDEMVGVSRS